MSVVHFTYSHTPILDVKIVFAQDVIPFVFRIRSEAITRVLVFPPVNNYHRFLIHKVGRWVESTTSQLDLCAIAHQFDAHKSSRLVVIDKQILYLSCCLNCCFSCPPHKSKMNLVMFPQQKILEMLLREIFCNINCCALQ